VIRGKKSLHISMEYEVHSDFRIQCFKKGLSMQEVLAEFARRVGQESNDGEEELVQKPTLFTRITRMLVQKIS
jgi:hypothetical protein